MITKAMVQWINSHISIEPFLDDLGIRVARSGKMFCPFHHNVNTPSAVFYPASSARGLCDSVRCYTEGRTFFAYDFLKLLSYDEERIKEMVPEEFWYEYSDGVTRKIPVYDVSMREEYTMWEMLSRMDYIWKNVEQFKNIEL
jgi:hypothetical protein